MRKGGKNGTYQMFDRLFFLMKAEEVNSKSYTERFECDRHTFIRDREHLSLFYKIDFDYDRKKHKYIRRGNDKWNE